MTRIEFILKRDGPEVIEEYKARMRYAYRYAVRHGYNRGPLPKRHPYRRKWIEGYLEFK